jgi:hypothetical protein
MTELDRWDPADDGVINRIVDGELTPSELRTAVLQLDDVPDGWKRCALAFLEARCLREAFRAIGEPVERQVERPSFTRPAAALPAKRRPRLWLNRAIAAGIAAAAFGLGWLTHGVHSSHRTDRNVVDGSAASATDPSGGSQPERAGPVLVDSSIPGPFVAGKPGDDVKLVARLKLGSETSEAEVPILAGPGIDAEWLKNQPPPLSEHRQVVLRQHGYQVDQRRRFIATTLADGRRVAVPVDLVQIRYTGNNPL